MGIKEDFIEKIDKDWELVGEYKNVKTPALFRHNICGQTYMKTPEIVLHKPQSCRFCNQKKLMMSKDELLKRISHKKDRYDVLSEPMGWDEPLTVRHLICGKTFEQRLGVFVRSDEGCPHCKNRLISARNTMTHEDFVEKLGDRAKEYKFITKYKKAHEKIKVRHCCGTTFEITPDSMLRGGRCKACKYSTGEGQLYRDIKKVCPEAEQGNRTILPYRREIDVYLPSYNIGVEYDGLRYHTAEHFVSDKRRGWTYSEAANYHLWKTEECYKRGIRLIHFYEDEWLEHKDIVIDMVSAALKLPCKRIFARKTTVSFVSGQDANKFLDNNHIQGRVKSEYHVGLFYGGELVAIQSYSKLRNSLGWKADGDWELTRYATKLGCSVVGGFSKCMSFFEKHINTQRIVSFGDLRFIDRDNNVYLKNNFKQISISKPSYYYVKGLKRHHRFNYRKQIIKKRFGWLYDDSKTEKEMMAELGYERIYDCGKIRYEYRKNSL